MSPDPVHHDGIFSYHTQQGVRWGVRLKFHGRKKSWRNFSDKASAEAFRDQIRAERRKGGFFPEKYALTNGTELLTTTIDYYLTTIEHRKSARDERHYGIFWKKMFPRATVKSLTFSALEKARLALNNAGSPQERAQTNVSQHMAWLGHVINHAIARGIATTNPVTTFLTDPKDRSATLRFDHTHQITDTRRS